MSTIQEVLIKERKNSRINVGKMAKHLYGSIRYPILMEMFDRVIPEPHDFNLFNRGRVQIIKESYRLMHLQINTNAFSNLNEFLIHLLYSYHQMPGSVHTGMFIKSIEMLGTDQQHKYWLERCHKFEVIGAYAQTQLAHGSDVQNLETTATYVQQTDQFILNTPTITSIKYWPGELGLCATHALVFAQMFSMGINYGVHCFIVPIRDSNNEPLPGVVVGDIGPKIGYHSKDNGYLQLNQVRISKRNMLRRYVSVNKKGIIKKKGNPKMSYAAMMVVRLAISCLYPKIYAKTLIIATRYSLFRVQFRDKNKLEIPIIEYQAQKDKVISRIAQFYAISCAGNNIQKLCMQNFENVKSEDFSLMKQAHACLCLSKAFYGEIVVEGMEICRKACGGNGFSVYSGFSPIINQYLANVTMEGQNTVLYLQVGRFLLKNYKKLLTNQKKPFDSIRYLSTLTEVEEAKLAQKDKVQPHEWMLRDIQVLFVQCISHLLQVITGKMMAQNTETSSLDLWNKQAGISIKTMGMIHAVHYTYSSFVASIGEMDDLINRKALEDMAMLFGINQVFQFAHILVEGSYIFPIHFRTLRQVKDQCLNRLRQDIIGLVDSFKFPDKLIKSELIYGNPYQNYLNLARKNQINAKQQPSGVLVARQIPSRLAIHNPEPKL